jgi:KamA family protein
MNAYLRRLGNKSEKVRRQLSIHYCNPDHLPKQNPYGRNYFTIPQNIKAEHLYPTILLIKITPVCLGECAFCFREKQRIDELDEITDKDMVQIFDEYIKDYNDHQTDNLSKIKEILITGGDPFLLNLNVLEKLLIKAKKTGIEFIRIGSRATSASPWLITKELISMLINYKPLTIVAHYNHVDELTKDSLEASDKLLTAGIIIKNQSVLLRKVNDSIEDLYNLHWELARYSIQPYRLNHCMPVGYEQLRTTVREGIDLVREIQGMNGSIGHFHYTVITPFGGSPGFTENHIVDEKKGGELIEMNLGGLDPFIDTGKIDPHANYLKIRVTSKTIKDSWIPKEAWYQDGMPVGAES